MQVLMKPSSSVFCIRDLIKVTPKHNKFLKNGLFAQDKKNQLFSSFCLFLATAVRLVLLINRESSTPRIAARPANT
jgi:hypothetical protein